MGVKISKIAYYLPETAVTNAMLSDLFPDWSPDKIEGKIGVRTRFVVKDQETAGDLAFRAAEKVLYGIDRNEIDFLLLCTQSPDFFLPTTACILQERLGLSTGSGALDFNLGCSGYIYGLALAKGLISAQIASKVLLITSETYSKHIHPLDKGNRTIFGDGAAATIIEYTDEDRILNFELGTDGAGYTNLIVPTGGFRKMNQDSTYHQKMEIGVEVFPDHLYMNGPEIFNFTISKVPSLVQSVLLKNNRNKEDIDFYIFHQANKYMLEYLRKKLRIEESRFYLNMLLTGNTVSSTIPIALADARDNGLVKNGYTILLAGFGVGYSWGATIIKL